MQRCRDYALSDTANIENLKRALTTTLKILCGHQEDRAIQKIKKTYADQGMTERYRPLTKRLAKEKIRKINRTIAFTDPRTDDKETTKLVRRIIEKRAAQTVHKNSGKGARKTNRFRQSVRRATSFSLYTKRYTEYDRQLRIHGTHWKVVWNSKGRKMLVGKSCYNTLEEAQAACEQWVINNPEDTRPVSAYQCAHCNKWHIGHDTYHPTPQIEDEIQIAS